MTFDMETLNEKLSKTYYVVMTDKFVKRFALSGLGRAKNKINKLVLICDNYKEAEIVHHNALARSEEMKNVHITNKKPYYSPRNYRVDYADKSSVASMYKPHWFCKLYCNTERCNESK